MHRSETEALLPRDAWTRLNTVSKRREINFRFKERKLFVVKNALTPNYILMFVGGNVGLPSGTDEIIWSFYCT